VFLFAKIDRFDFLNLRKPAVRAIYDDRSVRRHFGELLNELGDGCYGLLTETVWVRSPSTLRLIWNRLLGAVVRVRRHIR